MSKVGAIREVYPGFFGARRNPPEGEAETPSEDFGTRLCTILIVRALRTPSAPSRVFSRERFGELDAMIGRLAAHMAVGIHMAVGLQAAPNHTFGYGSSGESHAARECARVSW